MPNRDAFDALIRYGADLAQGSNALADVANGSDEAYFEAGYFLIYFTMRGWRLGLGLSPSQPDSNILWAEHELVGALVANRTGDRFERLAELPMRKQERLMTLVTEHGFACIKRVQWYEQFAREREAAFAPGGVIWEFSEQLARSTNIRLSHHDQERLMSATAAVMARLDGQTLAQTVEGSLDA